MTLLSVPSVIRWPPIPGGAPRTIQVPAGGLLVGRIVCGTGPGVAVRRRGPDSVRVDPAYDFAGEYWPSIAVPIELHPDAIDVRQRRADMVRTAVESLELVQQSLLLDQSRQDGGAVVGQSVAALDSVMVRLHETRALLEVVANLPEDHARKP